MSELFIVHHCEVNNARRCHHRRRAQQPCLLRIFGHGGVPVVVLDQCPVVGGAAVTEEFSPGYSDSVASYTVSLLNPKITGDLNLGAHRLRIVERPIAKFLPLDDGRFLKVGGGQTKREVAKFSARDADRLDDYQNEVRAVMPGMSWNPPS